MNIAINNPAEFCEEVEKLIDRTYCSYDSPHLVFYAVYPAVYELYVQAKKAAREICHEAH